MVSGLSAGTSFERELLGGQPSSVGCCSFLERLKLKWQFSALNSLAGQAFVLGGEHFLVQ